VTDTRELHVEVCRPVLAAAVELVADQSAPFAAGAAFVEGDDHVAPDVDGASVVRELDPEAVEQGAGAAVVSDDADLEVARHDRTVTEGGWA
jgi:hypothetical protein